MARTVVNVTASSTLDGRDISADGTKLDGIEANATADQTAAEIKSLVEASSDIALAGNPTTTTQSSGNNSTRLATTAFVTTAVAGATIDGISSSADATAITIDSSERTSFSSASNRPVSVISTSTNSFVTFQDTNSASIGHVKIGSETDNMVFYANANERMRIDSSGDLGINTTSPNLHGWAKAVTLDTATNAGYELGQSGTKYGAFALQGDGRVQITNFTSNPLTFQTNNTERMRIDSSGQVGIGVSAPDALLTLDPPNYTSSVSDGMIKWKNTNNSGHSNIQSYFVSGQGADINIGANAYINTSGAWARWSSGLATSAISCSRTGDINFITNTSSGNGQTRMTIDSSGNVGLGVTPSAWGSGEKAFQILGTTYGGGIFASGNNIGTIVGANAYWDGSGYKRINAVPVSLIQFSGGNTYFYRDGTGAADSAVSLTASMVIDSSGNVGIGTTSPDQTLHVHKGSAGTVSSHASSVLTLENSTTGILQFLTPNTNSQQIRFGDPQDNGAGIIQYDHATSVMQFNVNGPERMRIDSSGNVGIGTTNPSFNSGSGLEISRSNTCTLRVENTGTGPSSAEFFAGNNKTVIGSTSNVHTEFRTNSVERMRIDTSGDLLIGRTSTGASASDHGLQLYGTGYIYIFSSGSGNNDVIRVYDSGGNLNAAIDADGDYHDLSDAKYKENIAPSKRGLSDIMGLNVVSFDWNNKDRHETSGFIAQEMEQAIPELVAKNKDTGDLSIKTNNLIPMLTKALQEAVTRIETLEAEVAALKGA